MHPTFLAASGRTKAVCSMIHCKILNEKLNEICKGVAEMHSSGDISMKVDAWSAIPIAVGEAVFRVGHADFAINVLDWSAEEVKAVLR